VQDILNRRFGIPSCELRRPPLLQWVCLRTTTCLAVLCLVL